MPLFGSNHEQQNIPYEGLPGGFNDRLDSSNPRGWNDRGGNSGNGRRGGPRGGHNNPGPRNNYCQNRGFASNPIPVHESPNPRYKGKNYDPNYHQKKNFTAQHHQSQYQHANPFPIHNNNTQPSFGPQSQGPVVLGDGFGDINMCDSSQEELQLKCGSLEKRYVALEADIKFFLEVLAESEGEGKIRIYLQQFAEAKADSPLADLAREIQ